uniref:DNA-directed DNA polymerase n=1 Tax=viral metagenome TaxID=1070528 RepID=A0A6C0F112_9ZZZZ
MSAAATTTTDDKKKKKIIIKPKPIQQQQQPQQSKEVEDNTVSIRLLDFNIYDENTIAIGGKKMVIQMFGLNEMGESCAIFVEDMNPFFYVLVPSDWDERAKNEFVKEIIKKLRVSEGLIIKQKCALVKRKKLYGFDGGKMHNFVVLYFKNLAIMNRVKNLWYISCPETSSYDLNPEGFNYNGTCLRIYESNIPPLLRFFHMNEISPSGWVEFSNESASVTKISEEEKKITTCMHEYVISMQDIHAQPDKETRVPYKICSFDIEASSSHGDFPLAIKTHKKLATNIVDVCRCIQNDDGTISNELLREMIHVAFLNTRSKNEYIDGNVQKIYSKRQLSKSEVDSLVEKFITEKIKNLAIENSASDANTIEAMFESIGKKLALATASAASGNGGDGEGDSDDGSDDDDEPSSDNGVTMKIVEEVKKTSNKTFTMTTTTTSVDKNMTVLQLLQSCAPAHTREVKINHLNSALSGIFPEVEGDKVTFIGSTFLKSGEERPYLNHCLTIDTCDNVHDVQNSEIQVCGSECDMLLEWTKLIQREDPDIIIGYNIFGFDYNFMFHRATENDCAQEFLKLSRIKGKVCGEVDPKTRKLAIEESTIVIASGQHDLQYIKMPGRLQIDMYNYLRRDYNMSSYKLDYVSGYFIGDAVTKIEHKINEAGQDVTAVYTGNVMGLDVGSYISFEETSNSTDGYKGGEKFKVTRLDTTTKVFEISGKEMPNMEKKVRWGLAKDDVTPQDIFRMTNEGPAERAIIAKYCIQDCNLVHHLMRKIDVLTGFIEMANICSVPVSFLVFRGQGIKLTSFIAKKCSEKKTLIPVLDRRFGNESYDGAIVLPPKCDLYLDNPVACVDYSSLYPSSMISENLSHDSKVWTKEYNLDGILVCSTGETDSSGVFIYDNLPGYEYVDVEYDTYVWKHNARGKAIKTVNGKKVCRFAQPKMNVVSGVIGEKAIMPSILEELLEARSATRKLIPKQTDDFMKNILDKRQLGYKVTANSLYGQCGAKTSSFYEIDVAASTTATGRKLLLYAKRVVEETYGNAECQTKYGVVNTRAETVYGDTDSAFFTFNLADKDGTPIRGKQALEITIELAQQVGELASSFLKAPHSLVYEKTIMPFCLLRKKGYVGIYYETNANKGTRKSMGIVLKRRDNAPIVKDVYGGIIDILMKEQDTGRAISFLKDYLRNLVSEKIPLEKLIITKSLNSNYKNPQQIAHKVLADRMGQRDSGNKPSVGDRIPFIYVHNPDKKALQGERIEHPTYIRENNIRPNYTFYITNQIMKPVQQLFALVLEKIPGFKRREETFKDRIEFETNKIGAENKEALQKKITDLRQKEVKALLFDEFLIQADNAINKNQSIKNFFK